MSKILKIGGTKEIGKRDIEVLSCDRCYAICSPFNIVEKT